MNPCVPPSVSLWTGQSIPLRLWSVHHELPEKGETVVFDEYRSELVLLNPIGGAIWELVDGERTVDEIIASLIEEVEDPPDASHVHDAVLGFLRTLEERGALRFRSHDP